MCVWVVRVCVDACVGGACLYADVHILLQLPTIYTLLLISLVYIVNSSTHETAIYTRQCHCVQNIKTFSKYKHLVVWE